ncbi:hypothetical protein EST38_g5916 [Candolleomyces aberdarensis]|uniref:Fungal-type protein kinase domain-containing protein n=1 Tax=Candolleomyces aberdarensis TaxID=2316362 RepID=A0A4Q2DLC4_9AGAR|nr:hypothetical protein EST38_g5916 [Candolleomyces aberdarensis]
MDSSTPSVYSVDSSTRENLHRLRDMISQDLGGNIPETPSSWAESIYKDLSTTATIQNFLDAGGEYCNGRWTRIPEAPRINSELHRPICRIINSVIQRLGTSGASNGREAVVGEPTRGATAGTEQYGGPDIAIKATGPSFSILKGAPTAFTNVAACFDVRLDSEADDVWSHLARMSEHAKHIFFQQPNRFYVRSMLVTQNSTRLFHFDRSGAQYTPPFNFHEDPHTFIRLILGLSTLDERILGLDDSIRWTTAADGTKNGGTLRTIGPDYTIVTYELVLDEEPFIRPTLRGRGTTCWAAKNSEGQRIIVKDYWVTDKCTSEFKLLEAVKGLRGICQMISYESDRAQTQDFRGNISSFKKGAFQNRASVRIVMKAYGSTIEKFTSIEQVLAALRGAITDPKEDERGVLIDLDMAFKTDELVSKTLIDHKLGTRMFQSFMVLKSCELSPEYLPPHDYLDDLESFFWIFTYILLTFKPNGNRMPRSSYLESTVLAWTGDNTSIICDHKWRFLNSPRTITEARQAIDSGWHCIYDHLFLGFRAFTRELSFAKDGLVYQESSDGSPAPDRFASILDKADHHYARVIGLFDASLEKLQKSGVAAVSAPKADAPSCCSGSQSTTSDPVVSKPTSVVTSATSLQDFQPVTSPGGRSPPPTNGKAAPCPDRPVTPPNQATDHVEPAISRSPKRRYDEVELDDEEDASFESKRRCPPSRSALRGILASVYGYCQAWL